ncbi:hypothetical protein HHI36_019785 [Cryptolaemus montrouzieri]|uniref:Uncharacterized protein n=1 Tax=Cryptolaemus montrouzieri TaxID=559131 RepID=A0ABD2N8L1_9CUCU
MKKCTNCDPSNKISPTINDQDLWLEMMNSMVHFTETSQALVRSMQGKLGVTPTAGGANKPNCDPCGLLEQLKGQLAGMTVGAKGPTVCKCTSPSEKMDKSCSSEDAKAGIQCYQSPKLIKKKKYKYSAEIESKLSSLKKKDSSPCVCEGKDGKKQVDTCLCENLPSEIEKRADCSEDLCPIAVCSALEQDEIENITCIGKTVAVQSEEPTPKETPVSMQQVQKADKDDPLAWILKPGTYNPDDLPQDDTHPFILKEPDTFKLPDNVLGYELFEAMEKFEDNIAQINYRFFKGNFPFNTSVLKAFNSSTSRRLVSGTASPTAIGIFLFKVPLGKVYGNV